MSELAPTPVEVARDVYLTVPLLAPASRDRLVRALHQADRRLGVGAGRRADRTLLIFMTDAASEADARSRASRLLREAVKTTGLAPDIATGMEIDRVTVRTLGPGRPRALHTPPAADYRTVALSDGRTLKAAHEGPTGDWIAYADAPEQRVWAGRDLRAVLIELLELPRGTDDWFRELVRELAGRKTSHGTRYPCPCCDFLTLTEPPSGTHAICPVCWWEDDMVQFRDLDYPGGANKPSLREARETFQTERVSETRFKSRARPPQPEEQP